jgi:hypothetical protein
MRLAAFIESFVIILFELTNCFLVAYLGQNRKNGLSLSYELMGQ